MADDNSFFDSQNFVKDLGKIFKAFAGDIESYRSLTTIDSLKTISDATIGSNASTAGLEPQESYCNCFYRLLGLPVITEEGLYSPGYSPDTAGSDKRNARHNIANKIPSNIQALLLEREKFPQSQIAICQRQNQDSSILSLALKFQRKELNILNKDSGPFDLDRQGFVTILTDDIKAKLPQNTTNSVLVQAHIIKPFYADPKIDFSVRPDSSQVSIPFLTDTERRSGNNTTHVRPLIEKACRIRFSVGNAEDASFDLKTLVDQVKNDQSFTDADLVKLTGGYSSLFQSDSYIKNNLFNIIFSVVDILADSYKVIGSVSTKINWIPMPDANGVQNGFTTVPYQQNGAFETTLEKRLSFLKNRALIAKTEFNSIQRQLGDSVFSEIDTVVLGAALQNIPTIYETELAKLEEEIEGESKKAENALYNIAVITGNNIGIGLIDMLAVYTALWTIPKNYLVDMMDVDSFNRMYAIPALRAKEVADRFSVNGVLSHSTFDIAQRFETEVRALLDLAEERFKQKFNNT